MGLNKLLERSDRPTCAYLEKMQAYHDTISEEGCLRIDGSARMSWEQVEKINSALGLESDT